MLLPLPVPYGTRKNQTSNETPCTYRLICSAYRTSNMRLVTFCSFGFSGTSPRLGNGSSPLNKLRSILRSASIRITSSCVFFKNSWARADKGGRSGAGGGLSLPLPLSDAPESGFDNGADGLAAAREAHHIRSVRNRSASGRSASMCL